MQMKVAAYTANFAVLITPLRPPIGGPGGAEPPRMRSFVGVASPNEKNAIHICI